MSDRPPIERPCSIGGAVAGSVAAVAFSRPVVQFSDRQRAEVGSMREAWGCIGMRGVSEALKHCVGPNADCRVTLKNNDAVIGTAMADLRKCSEWIDQMVVDTEAENNVEFSFELGEIINRNILIDFDLRSE